MASMNCCCSASKTLFFVVVLFYSCDAPADDVMWTMPSTEMKREGNNLLAEHIKHCSSMHKIIGGKIAVRSPCNNKPIYTDRRLHWVENEWKWWSAWWVAAEDGKKILDDHFRLCLCSDGGHAPSVARCRTYRSNSANINRASANCE